MSAHGARRRVGKLGGALVALAMAGASLVAGPAAFAHADADATASGEVVLGSAPKVGDAVYIGDHVATGGSTPFQVWFGDRPSGAPDAYAYCVEHKVPPNLGMVGTIADDSEFQGSNFFVHPYRKAIVRAITKLGYPTRTVEQLASDYHIEGLTAEAAMEATQMAIWAHTDTEKPVRDWPMHTPEIAKLYRGIFDAATELMSSPQQVPTPTSVELTAPASGLQAGGLVGPVTLKTNQASASLSVNPNFTLKSRDGAAVDASRVANGAELFLDLGAERSAGSAVVTASVTGPSPVAGNIVNVPGSKPGEHGQTVILVPLPGGSTQASVALGWSAAPSADAPALSTTAVTNNAADTRLVPASGATVTDTVSYLGLPALAEGPTPSGVAYVVSGELMYVDAKGVVKTTGITGESARFTAHDGPAGTVTVEFVVTAEQAKQYAGGKLVVFERLFRVTGETREQVVVHEDPNDAAQTVRVAASDTTAGTPVTSAPGTPKGAPVTEKPSGALANSGAADAQFLSLAALAALVFGVSVVVLQAGRFARNRAGSGAGR